MMGFTVDTTEIERNFDLLFVEMEAGARRACERWGQELQDYAKTHHPWRNRTGMTEATTRAQVITMQEELAVMVFAETPYSKFLELARNGEWSWLYPAVQAMEPRFYQLLVEELDGRGSLVGKRVEATA